MRIDNQIFYLRPRWGRIFFRGYIFYKPVMPSASFLVRRLYHQLPQILNGSNMLQKQHFKVTGELEDTIFSGL